MSSELTSAAQWVLGVLNFWQSRGIFPVQYLILLLSPLMEFVTQECTRMVQCPSRLKDGKDCWKVPSLVLFTSKDMRA